jgi:hypothetical protein
MRIMSRTFLRDEARAAKPPPRYHCSLQVPRPPLPLLPVPVVCNTFGCFGIGLVCQGFLWAFGGFPPSPPVSRPRLVSTQNESTLEARSYVLQAPVLGHLLVISSCQESSIRYKNYTKT